MSKKISLFTKIVTCLSIALFLQISVIFAQSFPPNILTEIRSLPQAQSQKLITQFNKLSPAQKRRVIATLQKQTPVQRMATYKQMAGLTDDQFDIVNKIVPTGRMVFELDADSMVHRGLQPISFDAAPDLQALFREGGVVYSVEAIRECPKGTTQGMVTHHRILFPDKNKKHTFITNWIEKKGSIKVSGKIRRWERQCDDSIREIDGGNDGKMTAEFTTAFQSTPRTFQIPTSPASGTFSGAGITEVLRPHTSLSPVYIGSSTAPAENKTGFTDPAYINAAREAAKRQGIPFDLKKLQAMEADAKKRPITFTIGFASQRMHPVGIPAVLVFAIAGSPLEPLEGDGFDDGGDDGDKNKCNYYLATNGLDTNPGTSEAPFATMQKSLDQAKTCRDSKKKPASITVKNGIYTQSASVTWRDTAAVPKITITGESATGVIFSKTRVIPFAIKMTGARNVTISNMTFRDFKGGNTPGLITMGSQVTVQGVNFQ